MFYVNCDVLNVATILCMTGSENFLFLFLFSNRVLQGLSILVEVIYSVLRECVSVVNPSIMGHKHSINNSQAPSQDF